MKRVEDEVDESTENVAVGGNQGVQHHFTRGNQGDP